MSARYWMWWVIAIVVVVVLTNPEKAAREAGRAVRAFREEIGASE